MVKSEAVMNSVTVLDSNYLPRNCRESHDRFPNLDGVSFYDKQVPRGSKKCFSVLMKKGEARPDWSLCARFIPQKQEFAIY